MDKIGSTLRFLVITTSDTITTSAPTQHVTSNVLQAQDDKCHQESDTFLQYEGGDDVSVKHNCHCCVGKRCHIMFQCKPWSECAYCNLVVPGKRNSDMGWLKFGRCTVKIYRIGWASRGPFHHFSSVSVRWRQQQRYNIDWGDYQEWQIRDIDLS